MKRRICSGLLCLAIVSGLVSLSKAADRVLLELNNGDKIEGVLLRKNSRKIHILVGDSVLSVDRRKVKRMTRGGKKNTRQRDVTQHNLYSTAKLPKQEMQALVEKMGPAIAVVKTPRGLGTGWFCHQDGYLVTNQHVVAGERTIRVTVFPRQGKTFGRKLYDKVRIVALNAQMDLALLKIEDPLQIPIPQLYLGETNNLKVGDKVFAIGNPLGLERSTSQGIISKVGRNISGRLFIQTTAPIAPGNSGGPLFNERGEIIGVVSRGAVMLDGLGFAIPSDYIREFLDNIEAFAYDGDNPNTGVTYMETPVRSLDGKIRFNASEFIPVGHGLCCMEVTDLDADGAAEVVFADNNKGEIGILKRRKRSGKQKTKLENWDINRLPRSRRFVLETHPVSSRVFAIRSADANLDGKLDLVFYGDQDGLAMLPGLGKAKFGSVKRIANLRAVGHQRSIESGDFDGDGKQDLFVLGPQHFHILWQGSERQDYPLGAALYSNVWFSEFSDINGDGRLDLVLFTPSKHYAVHVRYQDKKRNFVSSSPLPSQISGRVHSFGDKSSNRFVALDGGINRVRLLTISNQKSKQNSNHSLVALPIDPSATESSAFELCDLEGDSRPELLAVNQTKSEFAYFRLTDEGFTQVTSPAPQNLLAFDLYRDRKGRGVLFSFSKSDKLFGVSQVKQGRISFPRPIHTTGRIQWMQLERLSGLDDTEKEKTYLIWAQQESSGQVLKIAPAEEVAELAYRTKMGALDVKSKNLSFDSVLPGKVKRLAFADFNQNGHLDLVIFWAYSGKQSLYLGQKKGHFREVIKQQEIIENKTDHQLLVVDLDGDGQREVLLVHPTFIRVLGVDANGRLFVKQQINWPFGKIEQLANYNSHQKRTRLVAITQDQAHIIQYDSDTQGFKRIDSMDLTGLKFYNLQIADIDGDKKPDLLGCTNGTVQILLDRAPQTVVDSKILYNASMDYFLYFDLFAGDLDHDGLDEVILFDKRKAVIEILRYKQRGLQSILRERLFVSQLQNQQDNSKQSAQPKQVGLGDLDGNGKNDLVFVIHDRLAIYLQDAK